MSEFSLYWILAWAAILMGMLDGMSGVIARVGWSGVAILAILSLIHYLYLKHKGR